MDSCKKLGKSKTRQTNKNAIGKKKKSITLTVSYGSNIIVKLQ